VKWEHPARVALQPGADLAVLAGGVVVGDGLVPRTGEFSVCVTALAPLPADPDTIMAYLTSVADTLSCGTLMRRLAAIDPAEKALMREVRGAATPQAPAATPSGAVVHRSDV
jgi:hypothetical protein